MTRRAQDNAPTQSNSNVAANLVMLPNKKLENVDANNDGKIDGFQFDIANPFYTGEPVSSIRNLEITVDSEKIDPEKITLILREQRLELKNVPTLYELLWGFGEVVSVYIEKPGGLKKGSHEVECVLLLRPSAGDYGQGDMKFPKKTIMTME